MPVVDFKIANIGPFKDAEFSFDPQINVFVGPNNSGKSTILLALAEVLINPFTFPPKLLKRNAHFATKLVSGHGKSVEIAGKFPINFGEKWKVRDGNRLLAICKQQGYITFVPALRLNTDFRSKGPTVKRRSRRDDDALRYFREETANEEADSQQNPTWMRDEQVIQELIALDYRAYRERKPEIRNVVEKIATLASKITEGFPIEFVGVEEDKEGLFPVFQTPDGKVPLNVLSQGTQSLIQWLAHFVIGYAKHYRFGPKFNEMPAVLLVDEIDAHLHPSWQRRILPELTRSFPNLQVFCSTHSPLMLAGLKAGQIQLLKRSPSGQILSSRNHDDVVGWSSDEIYSSFLGVDAPTDVGTQQMFDELQLLRNLQKPTQENRKRLNYLRNQLAHRLHSAPSAMQAFARGKAASKSR